MTKCFSIVVLISGNGSNLQAIIDAHLPINIATVISDQANAYGLERAKKSGIPTIVISSHDFNDRESYDRALQECIDQYQVDLIVLSGFMRILSNDFVNHYAGKIINIHPSLLPKYPGLKTYEKAIAAGDKEHGTTIHFVTSDLDAGPIIAQGKIAILNEDTPNTLKQRTQQVEHQLYPQVIRWISEGKVSYD